MLIAELRRKLMDLDDIAPDGVDAVARIRSLLHETKEDLLTADVFGVLKYLPRHLYLDAVFEAIANHNPQSTPYCRHLTKLKGAVATMEFRFWPGYATPEGLPGQRTEPDVQISDSDTLLFVEAKLGSGFGDHQVERELAVAIEASQGREVFVLLVTPGSLPPHFSVDGARLPFIEYIGHMARSGSIPTDLAAKLNQYADRVLWISWDAVLNALASARRSHAQAEGQQSDSFRRASDMLNDLMEVMLLRRLQPFQGLGGPIAAWAPCSQQRPVLMPLPRQDAHSISLGAAVAGRPCEYEWKWKWRGTGGSARHGTEIPEKRPAPKAEKGTASGSVDIPAAVGRWDIPSTPIRLLTRGPKG